MIEFALKVILIAIFYFIFRQDKKDRLVYWFLYPLTAVLATILQVLDNGFVQALINSTLNIALVLLLVLISYLYAVLVMKKRFLNESIGAGDILFFLCLTFCFGTISFVILFVFSLFFSLVLHLVLSRNRSDKTVPLAGYMALFFAAVYVVSFFMEPKYFYSY